MRGSIVDVFPSTADAPVRIDLWGDEVDRLTEFSRRTTSARRPTSPRSRSSPPRAAARPTRCAPAAGELVGPSRGAASSGSDSPRASCSTAWSRGCRGSPTGEHVLVDLARRRRAGRARRAAADARPRRRPPRRGGRPRRRRLAKTWGASRRRRSPLHAALRPPARAHDRAARGRSPPAPNGPTHAAVEAHGVGPGRRRRRRAWPASSPSCSARATASSSPPTPRARRAACTSCCSSSQPRPHARPRRHDRPHAPGGHIVVAPLDRGFVLPRRKLAVLTEADLTGRRRAHRRPRPQRRDAARVLRGPQARRLRRAPPRTASARYGGMVKRTIGGVERDYLLLEYKGGDRLYVPSDQIDAVRHYTGGETPDAAPPRRQRLRRAPRHACEAAVREIAQELVVLYQRRRAPRRVTRSRPTRRGSTSWRRRSRTSGDARSAEGDRRREGRHGGRRADGSPRLRRRRLRQDRGRHPRRVQGGAGRQAGRGARAHDAARAAALRARSAIASRRTRCASRCCPASSRPARPSKVVDGVASGEVDIVIGTHRLLSEDVDVQASRPARRRRGAALRRQPQGGDEEAARPTSTCSR